VLGPYAVGSQDRFSQIHLNVSLRNVQIKAGRHFHEIVNRGIFLVDIIQPFKPPCLGGIAADGGEREKGSASGIRQITPAILLSDRADGETLILLKIETGRDSQNMAVLVNDVSIIAGPLDLITNDVERIHQLQHGLRYGIDIIDVKGLAIGNTN